MYVCLADDLAFPFMPFSILGSLRLSGSRWKIDSQSPERRRSSSHHGLGLLRSPNTNVCSHQNIHCVIDDRSLLHALSRLLLEDGHQHGEECGHVPLYHNGHVDFLVEGEVSQQSFSCLEAQLSNCYIRSCIIPTIPCPTARFQQRPSHPSRCSARCDSLQSPHSSCFLDPGVF